MNRFAVVGAALAVLLCAAVALAASPSPSPAASPMASPVASPNATTVPSSSPSASPTPSPTTATNTSSSAAKESAQAQTWTADVDPVNIGGSVTVTRNAEGTGMIDLKLTGLVNSESWTVDVEPGSIQHPNQGVNIAFKQGSDVEKISPDTIRVHLTKDEMDAFTHALNANPDGVTVFVSDGHRLSAASIPGTQQ